MSLGDYIRKVRLQKAYSQQFIADSIGVSQSKLNRIENGKSDISVKDLEKISQILRINYIDLLQSNKSGEVQTDDDEVELSLLYNEIKSLKCQLTEIKEYLDSNNKIGGVNFC